MTKLGTNNLSMHDILSSSDSNDILDILFYAEISILLGYNFGDTDESKWFEDKSVILVFYDDFDYVAIRRFGFSL